MKDKIKKFYEDHKIEIIVSSAVVLTTAVIAGRANGNRYPFSGNRIESADFFTRGDGIEFIQVFTRDGRVHNLRKKAA